VNMFRATLRKRPFHEKMAIFFKALRSAALRLIPKNELVERIKVVFHQVKEEAVGESRKTPAKLVWKNPQDRFPLLFASGIYPLNMVFMVKKTC
jgi:hypothetical protein